MGHRHFPEVSATRSVSGWCGDSSSGHVVPLCARFSRFQVLVNVNKISTASGSIVVACELLVNGVGVARLTEVRAPLLRLILIQFTCGVFVINLIFS